MDPDVLVANDIEPVNPRRAFVEGYALRIGQRATLVPSPGARAYGVAYALTQDELDNLYSGPGLDQYWPESVLAESMEGVSFPALSYILSRPPGPEEADAVYAKRLREVLDKLGFPPEYVAAVE